MCDVQRSSGFVATETRHSKCNSNFLDLIPLSLAYIIDMASLFPDALPWETQARTRPTTLWQNSAIAMFGDMAPPTLHSWGDVASLHHGCLTDNTIVCYFGNHFIVCTESFSDTVLPAGQPSYLWPHYGYIPLNHSQCWHVLQRRICLACCYVEAE